MMMIQQQEGQEFHLDSSPISLLWPTEEAQVKHKNEMPLSDRCYVDLGVDQIVQGLCLNHDFFSELRLLLANLCNDPEVIGYRLDIIEDLMKLDGLCEQLEEIIPLIRKLEEFSSPRLMTGAEELRKIAWRLEILSMYAECVAKLHATLQQYHDVIQSDGLNQLLLSLDQVVHAENYQAMVAELPELRAKLQGISSITIGINLNSELRPTEAILLSVEPVSFKEKKRSFVSSILGLKSINEPYQGISQFQHILREGNSPLESALVKNLDDILKEILLPIGSSLQRFIRTNIRNVTSLHLDLLYFVGACKLFKKLQSVGLNLCKPTIAPADARIFEMKEMTDLIMSMNLNRQHPEIPLQNSIIGNDVTFDDKGRIFILTGPNQGGKTTYTRAIGVAQLLFQAGLYVPGTYAHMSPVDWIYTHFSEEELPNINNGRLGEESRKLADIFEYATDQSLILLNESLSSTSSSDSLFLARDLIKGIKMIGSRVVFATHLLELAAQVEDINEQWSNDTLLISMVAGILQVEDFNKPIMKRTYKVTPGPPMEMSYARDIAHMYGISFERITEKLKERKLFQP